MESTVAMCDFQMLWIAEVSGAKEMGRGHHVYQDVGGASGAIKVLKREKSPTRVCSINGRGRNHIDIFQRDCRASSSAP